MAYAWVTLTGKVYVEDDELEEGETFADAAERKIHDHFPTDEPIKLAEVEIDMDTYKS